MIFTLPNCASLDAYGWLQNDGTSSVTDEQILERLLALNLQRAATQTE